MAGPELQEGERELGDWTLNYVPPGGGRYTGKLTVTDRRLIFDAKFDTSAAGTLRELFVGSGEGGYVSIPKSAITATDVKGSLKKKIVVRLEDGGEHTFDYGVLPVKNVVAAIAER